MTQSNRRLCTAFAVAAATGAILTTDTADAIGPVQSKILTPAAPYDQAGATAAGPNGSQAGWVHDASDWNSQRRPVIWNGTPQSVVNLAPQGVRFGEVLAADGPFQGGFVVASAVGIPQAAALWSGSADSYVSLRPIGAEVSVVRGMKSGQQVGDASTDPYVRRAALWNGTAQSYQSLHQAGWLQSIAYATNGSTQVGVVEDGNDRKTAAMWHGSAESFIDLGAGHEGRSRALAVSGNEQAGYHGDEDQWDYIESQIPAGGQPALWHGTPESLIDLTPTWSSGFGAILSTIGGIEVGYATSQPNFARHATLWFGTADGALDLHAFLPGNGDYAMSWATALTRDGDRLDITGMAGNTNWQFDAVLWTVYIPEPHSLSLLAGGVGMMRRRRRRAE